MMRERHGEGEKGTFYWLRIGHLAHKQYQAQQSE